VVVRLSPLIGWAWSRDIYRLETHFSATSIRRVMRFEDWIDRISSVSSVCPELNLATRRRAMGLRRGRQTMLTERGVVVSAMQWRRQTVTGLREKHTSSTPSMVRSSFNVFSFLQKPDNTNAAGHLCVSTGQGVSICRLLLLLLVVVVVVVVVVSVKSMSENLT